MNRTPTPDTVHLALLAELHPTTHRPERIHAVLAWTDTGQRHYQPLTTGGATDRPVGHPVQLSFDLGALSGPYPSSSGLTWRTWSLASVPTGLRHLTPDGAAEALAGQLAR
jgi:hypothetical protein